MSESVKSILTRLIPVLCAVLVVIICASVLFTDGGAGLSDNGDFQRVLDAAGMEPEDASYSRFMFKRFYVMDIDGQSPLISLFSQRGESYLYKSPHMHFVNAAKFLNYVSNFALQRDIATFDIFALAFLYILILAVSAYLIVSFFKKPVTRALAAILFLVLFCDEGYILYFNSLYGEGLQFVSLLLIVGLILSFIRNGFGYVRSIVLFAAIYYFGGSKLANIPLALLLTASTLVFIPKCSKPQKSALCVFASAMALCLGVMFISIPSWMNNQTTYQSVFFGILKESPTPEEDLKELGLSEDYAVLSGTHAYMSEYPIDITSDNFNENFYGKTGKLDSVLFYAKHPVRFISKCAEAIEECTSIRPVYLGSSPHHRMGQTEKFGIWSNIRGGESIFTNPLAVLPILSLFTISVAIWMVYIFKRKSFLKNLEICTFLIVLACALWANLLLPVAGNGDADLLKHMFLFIHLTDIAVFLGVMALVHNFSIKSASALALVLILVCAPPIPKNRNEIITFGQYNGSPITWQIMTENNDEVTLISKDILFYAPFDMEGKYGSNLWAESDIREYLNGEFLNSFSANDINRICDTSHTVTLSAENAYLAENGTHPPYWRVSRENAADMYDETFRHTVSDKVYLPDTVSYSNGFFDRAKGSFYLIDPYGSSSSMVRYCDKNGVLTYCGAGDKMGIRPVITIKKGK